MSPPHPPRLFLSAGETSGDHYGAALLRAVRRHCPQVECTGLGGLAMERAGQRRVVRAEDVAVMGITEILRHVPRIYRSYRRLVRSLRREKPDVAVLIDFPDVNFRLARHLHRAGVPVIWFVSPQLWAWKRRRLRWVQERVSRMLVIFPFEEPFYRARGVAARFVGHPLAELPQTALPRESYAREHGLNPAADWIALLPGSRWREVEANLPEMVHAAQQLAATYDRRLEFLLPVASGLPVTALQTLTGMLASTSAPDAASVSVRLVPEALPALQHARASVVASGTATILAALAGQPFVVVYRVSPLTYAIARRLVRYPPEIPAERDSSGTLPIAMVNLIAGRRVVPELLNERFDATAVVRELKALLSDGPARESQLLALAEVRGLLRSPGPGAIETVAAETLSYLSSSPSLP